MVELSMRCMIQRFPPPSPYTSVWCILEHSSKHQSFEIFVLQCSIQWWTYDKVALTSLCREELPAVTLSYFCQLFITPHILLTRQEDFSVRRSYLFQWTLAYVPLCSLQVCTQHQTEGNSLQCWTGSKTGLRVNSGSRTKSDEKPHVCYGKSPCNKTSWTKPCYLKTDLAEKVPRVLTQNFNINKWVHQQCTPDQSKVGLYQQECSQQARANGSCLLLFMRPCLEDCGLFWASSTRQTRTHWGEFNAESPGWSEDQSTGHMRRGWENYICS